MCRAHFHVNDAILQRDLLLYACSYSCVYFNSFFFFSFLFRLVLFSFVIASPFLSTPLAHPNIHPPLYPLWLFGYIFAMLMLVLLSSSFPPVVVWISSCGNNDRTTVMLLFMAHRLLIISSMFLWLTLSLFSVWPGKPRPNPDSITFKFYTSFSPCNSPINPASVLAESIWRRKENGKHFNCAYRLT